MSDVRTTRCFRSCFKDASIWTFCLHFLYRMLHTRTYLRIHNRATVATTSPRRNAALAIPTTAPVGKPHVPTTSFFFTVNELVATKHRITLNPAVCEILCTRSRNAFSQVSTFDIYVLNLPSQIRRWYTLYSLDCHMLL